MALTSRRSREGIDIDKALQLVNLVREGIYNRYLPLLKTMTPEEAIKLVEKIRQEVRIYFNMLIGGIYE